MQLRLDDVDRRPEYRMRERRIKSAGDYTRLFFGCLVTNEPAAASEVFGNSLAADNWSWYQGADVKYRSGNCAQGNFYKFIKILT
ncbi:unnamed protein product [Heligmosomoides polygyrus]|uniref:Lipoprotein n=1 Tax=Heligmosomoides polygyrus TaxID=6339 RepID=A0A183GCQ4_HELPZ|nr:unnamed protein product [Heligmosomoides polygyrus]